MHVEVRDVFSIPQPDSLTAASTGTAGAISTIDGSIDSMPHPKFVWRGFVMLRNRISYLATHFMK